MALGHPHDCVTASSSTQAGTAQLLQMLLVRVTVGHPVCKDGPVVVLVTSEKMTLEMVLIGIEVTCAVADADLQLENACTVSHVVDGQ